MAWYKKGIQGSNFPRKVIRAPSNIVHINQNTPGPLLVAMLAQYMCGALGMNRSVNRMVQFVRGHSISGKLQSGEPASKTGLI